MSRPTFRTDLQRILFEEGRKQTWLSDRTGIHASNLSQIVTGRLMANQNQAEAIAEALGREIHELGLTVVPTRSAA